jgi:choline dehydrogenase
MREHAYGIFVRPIVANRTNLRVITRTRVDRILWRGKKAIGVMTTDLNTNTQTVYKAEKEVILSAGVIETPKILQLSGVGARSHLNSLGIREKSNRPGVGQNLQDHISVVLAWKLPTNFTSNNPDIQSKYQPGIGVVGLGPFTEPARFEFSMGITADFTDPTFQRTLLIGAVSSFNLSSRGSVMIGQNDPSLNPIINDGYLSVPSDLQELVDGVNLMRSIANDPALSTYFGVSPGYFNPSNELFPGSIPIDIFIRSAVRSDSHYVGTAKMGDRSDSSAVVDKRLRVIGVDNLRVVDASIMPEIVAANTNAASMMIGVRGAHFILEDNEQTSNDDSLQNLDI